jgi:hypothetical protein
MIKSCLGLIMLAALAAFAMWLLENEFDDDDDGD